MGAEIQVRVVYLPGYGGPSCWKVRAVCDNHLLEKEQTLYSEREVGQQEVLLQQKWKRNSRRPGWAEWLAARPLASSLCSVCGGNTLDGISSVAQRAFCQKTACQAAIPAYQEEVRRKQEEVLARYTRSK